MLLGSVKSARCEAAGAGKKRSENLLENVQRNSHLILSLKGKR